MKVSRHLTSILFEREEPLRGWIFISLDLEPSWDVLDTVIMC